MKGFSSFLQILFTPFFNWWWAAITGSASIASLFLAPRDGITLSRGGIFVLALLGFTLGFVTLSAVLQSWTLYMEDQAPLAVRAVQRSKDLGGEWVFILAGRRGAGIGAVVDVNRKLGDIEVPFVLLEIVNVTATGEFLAVPIRTAAGHLRDLAAGKFTHGDMVVQPFVRTSRIRENPLDG